MGTELTPMQSFEQNIKEKLTADIGKLIPDEALTGLINRSIEEMFFGKRIKRTASYGGSDEVLNSYFEALVKKLMQDRVDGCIRQWMKDNKKLVAEHMKEFMDKQVQDVVMGAFTDMFKQTFENMKFQIQNDISQNINRQY